MTIVFLPSLTFAAPNWEQIKTLKCTFTEGASFNGEEIMTTDKPFGDESTLVFDSIDLKSKMARLIGNAGADDVAIFGSRRSSHYD
ncbi:MAG: hypothetical protein ACOYJ2_07965 [Rickettsiales bacterium]